MWRFAFVGLMALPLAGCQTGGESEGVIGAYQRTETVRYNKRDYTVSFIYSDSSKSYDVKVRRQGRPMDAGAKDRNNATQVAASTVSYYACPAGYRAKPIGSAQFASAQWSVNARCAKT
ncbi:MAG: hypothetical protein AAGF86_04010 [Pseudomonadota bacterium]